MKRIRIILLLLILLLFILPYLSAQENSFSCYLGSSAGYITSGHVPFWLRSNQFGSIPIDNASLSLFGAMHKDYNKCRTRIFDWGASVEGRANIGDKSNLTLIEGYGKLRISIFEIRAGRSKEIMGLCDTSLSSGSFSVSGNALGIPKVEISVGEFYSLPFFGRLFAFKGNFVHGCIGEASMNMDTTSKPKWKFKLYGGFNHLVLWGNEKESYGNSYSFSPLKTYLYVIRGGTYKDGATRLGDHLGSIEIGFEYEFKNV